MTNETAVVLARPMNMRDPAFIRAGNEYGLKTILEGLLLEGVFSNVVLSVPDSIPSEILDVLKGWTQFSLDVSPYEQPQKRLIALMKKEKLKHATLLTSYSVLMDADALLSARAIVAKDQSDAVYPENVIAPKYFMVISREAAQYLEENFSNPLPPFIFHTKLAYSPNLKIEPVSGLENSSERFLWELLFAGERNSIPSGLLEIFLKTHKIPQRFQRKSFESFINDTYQLAIPDLLSDALQLMKPYDSSLRVAMQLNNALNLIEHLPEHLRVAVEVGHGRTPLTTLLMALVFDHVAGADPYKHNEIGVSDAHSFLKLLSNAGISLLPQSCRKHTLESALERSTFAGCEFQDLPVKEQSVDFCYSRMVLEHVIDMEGMAKCMAKIIRPNGVMIHEIGLQDHEDLSNINFEFLSHSVEEWLALDKGTNLLRVNDFIALFQSHGFAVETLVHEERRVPPAKLHSCWDEYDENDLYCYRAILKCTKK